MSPDSPPSNPFFDHPILNSPYKKPARHWELDEHGQPTQRILEYRRRADFITPIPKPKKHRKLVEQESLVLGEGKGLSTKEQQFQLAVMINEVRSLVEQWRTISDPQHWQVTPETARLLRHWREHDFTHLRPFFCQIEAVETAIWLTEVAPHTVPGKRVLEYLARVNADHNADLTRIALKMATGAGKTMVMAMLIAWQTINAARRTGSKHFTKGFLVCTPGLTIKDRLRVLQPNDPESYYFKRELVPTEFEREIQQARIVITNYHAFIQRERIELSKGGRDLLKGRRGEDLDTRETEGQMIQRVMPELMGMKHLLVINDEAHHCYRAKPPEADDEGLKGEARSEAEKNNEQARVWSSGVEAVHRTLGTSRVIDLSATPFFLSGSGYPEAALFPWVLSDFSLMDAIESGIVKLPRVPIAENIAGAELPMFRDLWVNIRDEMPKTGRAKAGNPDPSMLPVKLKSALDALYGHYAQTFELWKAQNVPVPPCFILVCQNTAISKLVFDYISGYVQRDKDGGETPINGALSLFRNYDEQTGDPLPRPRTLLIDSEQLEAGEALDKNFRALAADEIERFRRERIERTGDRMAGENISDQDLLREVMNTVGKPGQLGAEIRCVVSVAMLTEGWDASTVTHVFGIRAFGTQLLCEQVIGRALRRQSYDLNAEQLFNVEYADVFGVPFDFTAKPVPAPPQPPRQTVTVRAISPERDTLEIRFPRVAGYRVELPQEKLTAKFTEDSELVLTPDMVGPTQTRNAGIIGKHQDMTIEHMAEVRRSTLIFNLTQELLLKHWRDAGEEPKLFLFGQLKSIVRQWLETCLRCEGATYPGLLMYRQLADIACTRITAAITSEFLGRSPIKAILDPYTPTGSTRHVRFTTSRAERWETAGPPPKNHVNWVIYDSDWEAEFCRVAEQHPHVVAYTKNHALGFEVPYRHGAIVRRYRPDFILLVDDGRGAEDLLRLVVEIKGYRGEDAKDKKLTMDSFWIPGVNNLGGYGRWAFAEFRDVHMLEEDLNEAIRGELGKVLAAASAPASGTRD